SRAGNGAAGMGWSLSGLSSIHRCPQTPAQDGAVHPVDFTNDDRLCLDGQRLVPVADASNVVGTYGLSGTAYHTELETFARITQYGGDLQSASTYFKVELKSGEVLYYGGVGTGSASFQVAPTPATTAITSLPLSWLIAQRADRAGNYISYTYDTSAGNGE